VEQRDKDELKNAVALFRYGLISAVVNDTFEDKSQNEYFRRIAQSNYTFLGKEIHIAPATIKKWYIMYRKFGYEGLIPKTRTDLNSSRKLSKETQEKIVDYKKSYPHISGTLIYNKLIEDGYINSNNVSKSTILKFIRDNYLLFSDVTKTDRRAFEMEFANDMWDADTSHGPYLTINGKKVKTYLIAIIDDASRLITNAKFYFEDNAINFQLTFKEALKKYGIPKKIFLDNGSTYKNEQLGIICANVGMALIYTKPYSPESKAKIERWFHTMKDTWMRGINWAEIESIDELNRMLNEFVNAYNNKIHSSLKSDDVNISPKQRWFKDQDKIKKIDNNLIDEYFLHTAYPRIRSDAIAYVKKMEYEVPAKYIGQKIVVKYDYSDRSRAWIYADNQKKESIKIVNKVENSKIKRKETLY
jgi:putative transposase